MASNGLCREAKADITQQAETRYQTALQVELSKGIPEEQAIHLALASFGSPLHANKAYKQKYLTSRQYKWLYPYLSIPKLMMMNFALVLMYALMLFEFNSLHIFLTQNQWAGILAIITGCGFTVFTIYRSLFVIPNLQRNHQIEQVILNSIVLHDVFSAFVIVYVFYVTQMPAYCYYLLASFYALISFEKFVLLTKIKRESGYLSQPPITSHI